MAYYEGEIAPMSCNNGYNNGFGDWSWIIGLALVACGNPEGDADETEDKKKTEENEEDEENESSAAPTSPALSQDAENGALYKE